MLMKNKPKTRKPEDIGSQKPAGGETRPASEGLSETEKQGFREAEPPGFRDNAEHSLDAAVSDPDVEDTIGGE